jgi:RecB family exonuclease/inactivated superfamily I helicase
MITPRTTRLVRVADLQAFRDAVITLATAGTPADARDRLVVVPTRAAAMQLVRSLEDALPPNGAALLPDMVTPNELVGVLAARLDAPPSILTGAEREVLLGVACRDARTGGAEPPFRLRSGLVAEALAFYDALRRNQKDVDTFERLARGLLEPGASYDRGAERLVRQTRFLVSAFRAFERRVAEAGVDEHGLRARLLRETSVRPWRDVVLTVTDAAIDRHGLCPADWDLLSRVPGLERLTVVVTDTVLAGALHERLHAVLPGIEEVRCAAAAPARAPLLVVPARSASAGASPEAAADAALVHVARDREEEVAGFARRVRAARDRGHAALDRHALVVCQPLPYVYVAREVLRSAGIPCQTFDALPLAAEPYAAATDLVLAAVSGNFARIPAMALLRSVHFEFRSGPAKAGHYGMGGASAKAGHYGMGGASAKAGPYDGGNEAARDDEAGARDIEALDRALGEAGYLGGADALERHLDAWRAAPPGPGRRVRALRAGELLHGVVTELLPLRESGPVAAHLALLLSFLRRHERLPEPGDPLRARQLRARAAILGTVVSLRDAYARFDDAAVGFDELAGLVRRWVEAKTFAPRTGDAGVHLVDAESARFGSFDCVHLAGVVDGEWPRRPQRNIFYSPAILRELGWPLESERLDGTRASFADLLRLPASRLTVSTFALEADALVSPSALVDEVERARLEPVEDEPYTARIFEHEALAVEPVMTGWLAAEPRAWAERRIAAAPHADARFHGSTAPHRATAFSLSALERYQDCAFKFFAADVLRLQEAPEDEATLSPRARGRFIHEVFQRFFEAWDDRRAGTITPDAVDDARTLFAVVAEPLLAKLPEADAALERTRLFGSAISLGIVDVVIDLEASRAVTVEDRWLEHRLEGDFTLASTDGRRVPLRGVADRIDLLEGRRLRVIDYKSGSAPNTRRALQVPIYALCAQERLIERDSAPWAVDEAAYVAFSGKRSLATVVKPGAADAEDTLGEARERVFELVAGIGRGEFPPRPHDPMICRYCAYASVCRKDYVGDD